ncbi:VCBS domain-containing protein [Achromobacter kerstersii]|uniref:VCBS domain-containing protein n=1 Tax=Achromobacter kerstersii TaxID=1353890 RepID=UPI0006C595DE|nr:VCBS domain-containing protein [Achromobacter kerstersii]CUI72965.1 VCBS repeat [Achromobacter kerstersii]
MQQENRPTFFPVSRTLALEPRLLFDAAGAVAAEQQHNAQPDAAHADAAQTDAPPAKNVLVIDARVNGAQALADSATPGTKVVVVDAARDGVAAVQAALDALGQVDSIQILGHGTPGQMMLGSSVLSAQSADTLRTAGWGSHLSANADILLYGCDTGQGQGGANLMATMATLTGADIAASTNDTGNAGQGGDWLLETSTGPIESRLAIDAAALAAYQGLMANADPTSTVNGSSADILLGSDALIQVTMTNPSTQTGYAPFIDVLLPTTGFDGDDGVTFVSASALGINLVSHVVTFGADGTALHPLARDANGNALVIRASDYGYRAGDQLVVLELPFAGFGKDQPAIVVDIKLHMSDLADVNKDHIVSLRSGFQYGNDALDNPQQDPSILEASFDTYALRSTPLTVTQTLDMVEGETVTGENFPHTLTVTATPAPGQTLQNVVLNQTLPDTIRVQSITPGAGGEITRLVLADGTELTSPLAISAALSASPYLKAYTVTYASLSAPTDTLVKFYVAQTDAGGVAVLDPVSGDNRTINIGSPTVAGGWHPLDPRDVPSPLPLLPVVDIGDPAAFVAKSITLHKTAGIAVDQGIAGLSPGDTLGFQYDIALSDYFAFGKTVLGQGQLSVTDMLGNGMTFAGTPMLTFTQDGQVYTVALVYTLGAKTATGTPITFDIAASLRNAGLPLEILAGDIASNGSQQGATRATVNYQAVIDQAYQGAYPQAEINEGDSLGNSAVLEGTVVQNRVNLGGSESDSSEVTLTIPTGTVDIGVFQVNGNVVSPSYELKPGDVVTFRLRYDLQTGDYENLKLTAYLPLPLFNTSGVWSQGIGDHNWSYGLNDTHPGTVQSVTAAAGDALVFDFGNYAMQTDPTGQNRIEVLFTLRVTDQPFADQRSITVLGQSNQLTTIGQQQLVSSDTVLIQSVAEPVLSITHGVVASTGGTVTGTTGTWSGAGTGGPAFTGSVTDLAALEGTVAGMDAGDIVRLATGIENTGGGGAFDVSTTVQLPSGLDFLGGSLAAANLIVARGDGTVLQLNVDYVVNGNAITFLDAGGQASLLAGRAGSAADTAGSNVVVITYDTVASASVAASQNLRSTAVLTRYASTNDGADFTPTDLTDTADAAVAAPTVEKVFAGGSLDPTDSSAAHTSGSDLVVGERMLYDIIVTLPEGQTQNLRLDDLIPAGMALDTSFGTGGYLLITTRSGSTALSADFAGVVAVASVGGIGGTAGTDGTDVRMTFSASSASANNNAADNRFVIRVALIAVNAQSNQSGTLLVNDARLTYSDPDGDTPDGATPADRNVAAQGALPTVTIVEPTLSVTQTAVSSGSSVGVDRGDTLTYTITISNGTAASDVDAFDVTLRDVLPTELSGAQIIGVTLYSGATITGTGDFIIQNGELRTADGSKLDIPKGGAVVLRVTGTLNALTGTQGSVDNQVNVQWTSLNGAAAGERTGADGLLASGVLNDYQLSNTLSERIAADATISHVGGLTDTAAGTPSTADPQDVAVGEIIHYRVAFVVPEGTDPAAAIRVLLPQGLTFMNDGTATLGFIADSVGGVAGLQSTLAGLIASGSVAINGGITDESQTLLAPDLSGTRATGVINQANINTSDPRAVMLQLGTLINANNDADFEVIYFEFNVRVDNAAGVAAGQQLAVKADFLSGGEVRTSTDSAVERVVEPKIDNLDKTVTAFDPGVGGATGQATYGITFGNTGSAIAYDVTLTDTLPAGGTNLVVQGLTIDGVLYAPGAYPAGVAVTVAGDTVTVTMDRLAVGQTVSLAYTADLPNNVLLADTQARVAYTSLPDSFQSYAGTTVGAAGTTGGERTGAGAAPNTYIDSDAAGVSLISGVLWNDTDSATGSTTADGPGLQGQNVTLTWGGADNDLATTADNRTWTVATDANGYYHFGVLGAGVFRIDAAPGITLAPPVGQLNVRIDSDGGTLAQVGAQFGDLGASTTGNIGYVERNDAPTVTPSGPQTVDEDTTLLIPGVTVDDPDSGTGLIRVTLTVGHGGLNLTLGGATVVAGALNSRTVTLQGTKDDLNTALATLAYTPSANYNGDDTLAIRVDDQGQRGDVDGDGIPFETGDDNLSASATVDITVTPVNDAPLGVNDTDEAVEAGGVANGTPGVDPRGNVLANDTDVDIETNQDILTVTSISQGGSTETVAPGTTAVLVGVYGELHMDALGGYQYVLNNNNTAVQQLLASSTPLTESFSYTLRDIAGLTSSASLTITIRGANDAPEAQPDTASVSEKGGTNNDTGGGPTTGEVLSNDSDVDLGDTRTVTLARPLLSTGFGELVTVAAGTTRDDAAPVVGRYGTLTLGADGTYRYVLDDANPQVQALNVGQTLTEVFQYAVTDAGGLNAVATITITINGANDNPVVRDNAADGYTARVDTANGTVIGTPVNPSGNVILDERDATTTGDVDSDIDNPVAADTISQIRLSGGADQDLTGPGDVQVIGQYGTLFIRADGTYRYEINSLSPALIALNPGETATENFIYTLQDAQGGKSSANLSIVIHGVQDQPVASDITGVAVEAGGVNNGQPGLNASGDVTRNDIDPDGDTLSVVGIRTGREAATGSTGAIGTALTGQFGTLILGADGRYTYQLNNDDATVQALRTAGDTLVDYFTYTVSDGTLTDTAELRIRIFGRNDAPDVKDHTGEAVEAGGTNNTSGGQAASGNVLDDAEDVDSGDTLTITGARTGAAGPPVADGPGGVITIVGTYGTLTLRPDGSYAYTADNNNPLVQALAPGQTLSETFSYKATDTGGLSDVAELTITIRGANDAPTSDNETAVAEEKGGTANGTGGLDPTGNLLDAGDTDPDNGDALHISGFRTGALADGGAMTNAGTDLVGLYGTLRVNADGSYTYTVNNDLTAVQQLRLSTQTLVDTFTFRVSDTGGLFSDSQFTVTIRGANDAPVAVADTGSAEEAGGVNNGTGGQAANGNVLNNDKDVDAGDTLSVAGVVNSNNAAGVIGGDSAGLYGTLRLGADGTYTYEVNNALAAVQQLRAGQSLQETFTYTVQDAGGLTHTAVLTITIAGRYDTPEAVNDTNTATAGSSVVAPIDATGEVLGNDLDVDGGDTKAVNGIRAGIEDPIRPLVSVGGAPVRVNGQYGWLEIGSDGRYTYHVDSSNEQVAALAAGQTLVDSFTYRVVDGGGLTDLAQLDITVIGVNDPPVAAPIVGVAIEQGDVAGRSGGRDASGDLTRNDVDVEGRVLTITEIRTGLAGGAGTAGIVGVPLQGKYGTLLVLADGTYRYTLDNSLPEVQALRTLRDTLIDTFTYTVADDQGASDQASIAILILGQNDKPVALPDQAIAIEAGGRDNGTPGLDPTGNVFANDTDVDADDTQTVSAIRTGDLTAAGVPGQVGGVTAGLYGTLTLAADGTYRYAVDNNNARVQALRTNGETLTEVFTYTLTDTAGASVQATLTITIHGQDDTPVARDDAGSVNDVSGPPVTQGNVLANDSDVDANEQLTVVGVRTAGEGGSAVTAGQIGQRLAGRYGFLTLNADGSYTYEIDLSNPDVEAARGQGPLLRDVFVYTISDRSGQTDSAQLTITLDMDAIYVSSADPHALFRDFGPPGPFSDLTLDPAVYVTPAVRDALLLHQWLDALVRGERPGMALPPEISLESLADGLGQDGMSLSLTGTIEALQRLSRYEDARMQARHGAISLSADGLLPDVSVFARKELEMHRPHKAVPQDKAPAQKEAPGQKAPEQEAQKNSGPIQEAPIQEAPKRGTFSDQINRLALRQTFNATPTTPQR